MEINPRWGPYYKEAVFPPITAFYADDVPSFNHIQERNYYRSRYRIHGLDVWEEK